MEKVYLNEKHTSKTSASTLSSGAKDDAESISILEKNKNHRVELDGHQLISVWGVKGVPTFGDKEMRIILDNESLFVTGQNLEIKLLDLEKGQIIAKGYVTGLKYSSGGEKGVLKKMMGKGI